MCCGISKIKKIQFKKNLKQIVFLFFNIFFRNFEFVFHVVNKMIENPSFFLHAIFHGVISRCFHQYITIMLSGFIIYMFSKSAKYLNANHQSEPIN